MTLLLRLPVFLSCGVALAACAASYHWENAAKPRPQWIADEASCRRKANREVERDYVRDFDRDLDRGRTLQGNMDRFSAAKRVKALVTRCMAAQGYSKVRN